MNRQLGISRASEYTLKMLPELTEESARRIQNLGHGERDLFTLSSSWSARAMSLRHAKAYESASEFARNKDVLELGCGSGSGAVYLSTLAKVTAIDVDPSLIPMLKEIWSGSKVEWMHYDGIRLPFPDQSFDLVTSFQVIEHVSDQLNFLKEIRRVLRNPGKVIITTPNRLLRVGPFQKPWNQYHLKELTSWEFRSLFLKAQFQNIQIKGLSGISEIVIPEHQRCLLNMLNSYGSMLPSWVKRPILSFRSAATKDTSNLSPDSRNPAQLSSDSYWWTTKNLAFSLDLLGIADI
jgi:ubiquinone/menaquinone biosynthesis C-methylase UbiE